MYKALIRLHLEYVVATLQEGYGSNRENTEKFHQDVEQNIELEELIGLTGICGWNGQMVFRVGTHLQTGPRVCLEWRAVPKSRDWIGCVYVEG